MEPVSFKTRFNYSLRCTVFLVFLLFAGAGCALVEVRFSTPTPPPANYIIVHKEGYPVNRKGRGLKPSRFKQQFLEGITQGIDLYTRDLTQRTQRHTCANAEEKGPLRLLLFVHGGLNPHESGLERTERLLNAGVVSEKLDVLPQGIEFPPTLVERVGYNSLRKRFTFKGVMTESDKTQLLKLSENHTYQRTIETLFLRSRFRLLLSSCYYPVFIVWNSSLFSSWWDDLFIIRRGVESPPWLVWFNPISAPFVFAGRLANGLVGVAPIWMYMAKDNWDAFTRNMPDEEKNNEEILNRTMLGASFFAFLPPRLTITWPLIKATGAPAWEMMKRRANLLLARRLQRNKYAGQGALRTLMESLNERITSVNGKTMWKIGGDDRDTVALDITLVGHSMGTLILDRFLEAFPKIPFRRIVYMASASSIADVEAAVFPYLDRQPEAEFWAFTLSRGDEARDFNLRGIDPIDFGSLLVLIDNFFEDVSEPGQLRFGRYTSLEENTSLRKDSCGSRDRVHVCKFDGAEGEPRKHGDFDKAEILERQILRRIDSGAFPN